MDKSGIYIIANKITKQFYIGSAASGINKRFREHKYSLKKDAHPNYKLQQTWNIYGEEAFVLFILEEVPPINCVKREQFWMDTLNPDFNILRYADSCYGRKHTEQTKQKMSQIRKADVANTARLRELAQKQKGIPLSLSTRKKLSHALKGRKISDTWKKNMSLAHMGSPGTRSKKIKCIELDKIFESGKQTEIYIQTNYNIKAQASAIRRCANHHKAHHTAYKFTWAFV